MLPDNITTEDLRAVVAENRSWRGVLRGLGRTSPHLGRQLRRECDELGVSYEHFFGMRGVDEEKLVSAIGSAATWSEALNTLGFSPNSGSARASVRRRATLAGLSTGHLDKRVQPEAVEPFAGPSSLTNLRRAAAFLVAAQCALRGFDVAWPLEPKPYDLIVDLGPAGLARVQVKSGTRRVSGSWAVWITRRTEGSDKAEKRISYTPEEIDYFGIVDGDQRVYMIPVRSVEGRTALSLRAYTAYLLPP